MGTSDADRIRRQAKKAPEGEWLDHARAERDEARHQVAWHFNALGEHVAELGVPDEGLDRLRSLGASIAAAIELLVQREVAIQLGSMLRADLRDGADEG